MTGPGTRSNLGFTKIGKRFAGVTALEDVSFSVNSGSVHALLGENGAGKSTLLKILSGAHRPDSGHLTLGGLSHIFANTAESIAAGVAVIYQELHLAPDLSIAENLFLGHLPQRWGWVRKGDLYDTARDQLQRLGIELDPRTPVGHLPLALRQMVEIAKALSREATVIAFDEPTSSLSSREVERLFQVIHDLRQQGHVILYVTHRMDEIYAICDAATVLRDGRHVETFPRLTETSPEMLIQRQVGRPLNDIYQYQPRPPGPPALEVDGLAGPGLADPVSFTVAQGEIVGFFGLVGAGRSEFMKLIFGAVAPTAGCVKVHGLNVQVDHPSQAIQAGIVLCPEDRKREGIIPIRSVMENLNLDCRRHLARLGFWIDEGRESANAQHFVDRLAIKTPSLRQSIRLLSGGNQQKVILARWLSCGMKVILLDEPTRGIDVGAKCEIYSLLYQLAGQGIGVVVVSSDLPEVMGVCDRILVMRQGCLVASVPRSEATAEELLRLALPLTEMEANV